MGTTRTSSMTTFSSKQIERKAGFHLLQGQPTKTTTGFSNNCKHRPALGQTATAMNIHDDPRDDTTTATPTNTANTVTVTASTNPTSSIAHSHNNPTNTGNDSNNIKKKKRNRKTMSDDDNHDTDNHDNQDKKNGAGGRDQNRGRGRGHSRGKNNNNNKNSNSNNANKLRRMSHALSWALRHSAQDIGLSIKEDGYVPVDEIIQSNHPKLKKVFGGGTGGGGGGGGGDGDDKGNRNRNRNRNRDGNADTAIDIGSSNDDIINDIRAVVETNDKQRFKLSYRPKALYYNNNDNDTNDSHNDNEQILCIRANQGHSMDCINFEKLLTKLSSEQILKLPCIVHGTYVEKWTDSIQQDGLHKMTRSHVHFATGVPQNQQRQQKQDERGDGGGDVISGIRKSCTVHIYLDLQKCAAAANTDDDDDDDNNKGDDGERIDFYMSDNGVVLTDGVNGTGVVPPKYFAYVVDVRTGEKLLG